MMYYSTVIAYVLWAHGGFGALGLHRFYLRKVPTGFLWLFTGGLAYMGAIYDFFTLPRQVREANFRAGYRESIQGASGERIIIRESFSEPASARESMEKVILKTAKKNGGLVSPGNVAIDSEYSTDEIKAALEKMVANGSCEMRVRPSGVIVYRFPEFAAGEEGFEPGL